MKPQLVMLAGPNGAGKTTFYELFLKATTLPLVNADRMVAAFQLEAYEAAKVADVIRREYLQRGASFVTETVFSDPVGDKLNFLREAVAMGCEVRLIYIGLASPMLAQARVAFRVAQGGHAVPDEKVAARYQRSLKNLAQALSFVPSVTIYDNSLANPPYRLVAEVKDGKVVRRQKGKLPGWAPGIIG